MGVNKLKKCWNEECGKEASVETDLINDGVLRKAVEFYTKNGKLDEEHEKLLAKTDDGAGKKKKKKPKAKPEKTDEEKEVVPLSEKFNKPCRAGKKCILKGKSCLFSHEDDDKPVEKKEKKE